MAELGFFDPSTVNDDRELLPEGRYLAQIVASDIVANKSGNGTRLTLTFKIMAGPLEGRAVFDSVTMENQSAQAVDIGKRQLKRLCTAVGAGAIRRSEELHLKPLMITVSVKPGEGQYGPSNVIKGYEGAEPNAGATPTAAAPTQAALAGSASSKRPWE